MADVRHRLITEGELHNPKGFASAGDYTELIRDENGVSRYKKSKFLEDALNFVDGNAAPPTQVLGAVYVIIDEGNGAVDAAWDGASYNEWLRYNGVEWVAVAPTEGVICYDATANFHKIFNGTSWHRLIPIAENISNTDLTWGANTTQDLNGNELTFEGGLTKFDSVELTATDRGLLLNRVTTAQMNGIVSPTTNEIVYNTDLNALYRYDGAAWVALSAGYGLVSVNDSSGIPAFYATFKAAIDAIGGNGVVNIHSDLLIDDVSEMATISTNDTLTINGNGYTITHTCNTGDDFHLINSVSSTSKIYLNNVKIISNGTAGGTFVAEIFGGVSSSPSLIQLSEDSYIEAVNNDIVSISTIRGGTLVATNRYALFSGTIENSKVTTKFGRGSFKNCEITINTGGQIGAKGRIDSCNITCDAISAAPIECREIKDSNIYCTGGTLSVVILDQPGLSVGTRYRMYNCRVLSLSSGNAVYAQYAPIANSYIYSENGQALRLLNANTERDYCSNITAITNSSNHSAVSVRTGSVEIQIEGLTAKCLNPANPQPALLFRHFGSSTNKCRLVNSQIIAVQNPLAYNISADGPGGASPFYYFYDNKMSEIGLGIEWLNGQSNAASNTLDSYGNGQIG